MRRRLILATALLTTAAARSMADPAPQTPTTAPISPRLQTQTPASTLPEALHNPTAKQAPQRIHQRDWGVFNRDGGVAAGFGAVARYGVDRAEEDWSYLRDPRLSDDVFDPLKFIPLDDAKDVYLTLSFDDRLKNWYETRPFLGQQKPDGSGRFTNRTIAGADLHLGPYVRLYGELINADAAGWGGYGYNQTYRKTLDVQQLFAEATLPVGAATAGAVVGRQEFLDAPNYVLYQRDTPDIPLSWNGGRAYVFWPRLRLDVFDFVQTNTNPTQVFGDTENYSARLWGAYASWAPPDFTFLGRPGHVFIDFFYLGYELGGSGAAIANAKKTTAGTTQRNDFGTRFWGKAGPVEFSLGGIYQGGEFRPTKGNPRTVDAFALNNVVGYRADTLPFDPFIALQADWYSGGNYNATKGAVGTYLAPYNPQTGYLDTTTYLTAANLIDVGPDIEMTPTRTTLVKFRIPFYWRASTDDAVYGSSRVYTFRGKYSGGYVGVVPQASIAWRITRHLTWTNDVARFLVSDSLAHAGGQNGTYYLSTFDFKF